MEMGIGVEPTKHGFADRSNSRSSNPPKSDFSLTFYIYYTKKIKKKQIFDLKNGGRGWIRTNGVSVRGRFTVSCPLQLGIPTHKENG